MAERANEKKRTILSSFVVLILVLSVLAASVATISAQPEPPQITNIIVTADPTSIPANGVAVSDITVLTEWSDGAIAGWGIKFEIISQPGGAALADIWDYIDSEGKAYNQLIAGFNNGEVVIKASAQGAGWYEENFTTVALSTPPAIIPWNDITQDSSTEVTIGKSDCVYFNATPDQPIDTWRWFLDGVDQSHNFDDFTHCWLVEGTYYVAVNATNANGTSNTVTWTVSVVDDIPPAAVTNLATSNPTSSTIDLTWTAPGDDGTTGQATTYDIRYSTSAITEGNWNAATRCSGEPSPQTAGSSETFTVTGLLSGTTYYFALKTADEVPNTSPISNSPSGITEGEDTTPPAAVTNLATSNPTSSTIDLTWTAPGDDGTTGQATTYDIRYSTSAITEGNWNAATPCSGEPSPQTAGSSETFTVTGLSPSTTYYFALKTADEVPLWSSVSNSPSGTTVAVVYGVNLTVEGAKYAEKTVAPGEDATYLLTVKNTGTVPDTYTLSVENPNGADVAALNNTTITNLAAGASAGVLLTVSDTVELKYVVNVTATGTGVSDKVTTETTVSPTGAITGKITYACNTTGIAGVTVNLTQGGSVVTSTTTDGAGNYTFNDVTPGDYYVNASKPRFWDNSTSVTVTAGETATADMMLWLKGDLFNDGVLDIYDIIMLRQAAAGNIEGDYRYDLYEDGSIDIYDIILLRQAVAGNIVLG